MHSTIETPRLILRRFRDQDLNDLYALLSDPEVVRYQDYPPQTLEQTKGALDWRISTDEMWAIEHWDDSRVIGNVYLGHRDFNALELGYLLNTGYWHRGYAKEACAALVADAFDSGIHRIFAQCDPLNPASWHLLEALGFEREAHLRQNVYFNTDQHGNPIWKDTFIYARLK